MGKFNIVKDEMNWLYADILGIQKQTGTGLFQSEEYTVYYQDHKKTNDINFIVLKNIAYRIVGYIAGNNWIISIRFCEQSSSYEACSFHS